MYYTFNSDNRCVCKSTLFIEYPSEYTQLENDLDYPIDQIKLEDGVIKYYGYSLDVLEKETKEVSSEIAYLLDSIKGLYDIVNSQADEIARLKGETST